MVGLGGPGEHFDAVLERDDQKTDPLKVDQPKRRGPLQVADGRKGRRVLLLRLPKIIMIDNDRVPGCLFPKFIVLYRGSQL